MTHRFFTKRWHSIALVAVVAMSLVAFGCDKTENNAVTNPNAGIFTPTGTIQGVLRDASTNAPIAGAVVDIGVGKGTTSETGQFTIPNVLATQDALNGTVSGSYQVTVDMRNVTSPVRMDNTSATPRYPNFTYTSVSVEFTSLNDTEATGTEGSGNPGGGAGSNHDTPVNGLVAPMSLSVGKLAANIDGIVARSSNRASVGAGFTVELVSNSGSRIATTTTDASGRFSFTNQSARSFVGLRAYDSGKTLFGSLPGGTEGGTFQLPAEGKTLTLGTEFTFNGESTTGPAVFVASTDVVAPAITSVSLANGADIPATDNFLITITFNEAITQDAYATALTPDKATIRGLYTDIIVSDLGVKAGNIAHSLAWSEDKKQLLVTIASLSPSRKYSLVRQNPASGTGLTSGGLAVSNVPNTVTFTTTGSGSATPPNIAIVDSGLINFLSDVHLDWNPSSGSFSYNVYRADNRVIGGVSIPGVFVKITPTPIPNSEFTDSEMAFTNGQIKQTFSYKVRGVNADRIESADSNTVTAEDKVGPRVAFNASVDALAWVTDVFDANTTLTVPFNELLDEATAEVPASYTVAGLNGTTAITVTNAVLNVGSNTVGLTLSAAIDNLTPVGRSITTGPNGVLNTPIDVDDVGVGGINGTTVFSTPGTSCIGAGTDNVFDVATVGGGDDTLVGPDNVVVNSGANGVCESTAAGNDVQFLPVGTGTPNVVAISAGPDGILQSVLAGDDTRTAVPAWLVTVGTSVLDVSGNPMDATHNAINPDEVE